MNRDKTRLSLISITLIGFLSMPIFVSILTKIKSPFKVETNNDWIGFYSGYFGSIIGVVGVYLVTRLDQEKRNKERDDELFLNNIFLYKELISALNLDELSILEERIFKFKENNNCSMINNSTRQNLRRIENKLSYYNETNGLYRVIENFIVTNFYDIFKTNQYNYIKTSAIGIEYQDLSGERLLKVTNFIINKFNIRFERESLYYQQGYKDEIIKSLKNNSQFTIRAEDAETIYSKVSEMEYSKEWKTYINKRSEIFKEVSELANNINDRIDRVLEY